LLLAPLHHLFGDGLRALRVMLGALAHLVLELGHLGHRLARAAAFLLAAERHEGHRHSKRDRDLLHGISLEEPSSANEVLAINAVKAEVRLASSALSAIGDTDRRTVVIPEHW